MQKKWQKKEKRDAKDFKGIRTPRSGGFWSFAGDVESDKFLIECKQTDKKGYRLTLDKWNKASHEALMSGKTPIMSLQIQDQELVVISKFDFLELLTENT